MHFPILSTNSLLIYLFFQKYPKKYSPLRLLLNRPLPCAHFNFLYLEPSLSFINGFLLFEFKKKGQRNTFHTLHSLKL